MVQFNFIQKEAIYKILYFGTTGSGKTTNLKYLAQKITPKEHVQLSTISASAKDNLWIDFLTVEAGVIAGMKIRFNIFSLPSQEAHDPIRKLFLQDADGLVFIADSTKLEENILAIKGIESNLKENGTSFSQIPLVIQWNKRDLPDALDTKILHEKINYSGALEHIAIATTGQGVFKTIESLALLVIKAALSSKQYNLQRKKITVEEELQEQKIFLSVFDEAEIKKNFVLQEKTPLVEESDRMRLTRTRLFSIKSSSGIEKEQFSMEESERSISLGKVIVLKLFGSIHPGSSSVIKNKVMEYYNQGNVQFIMDMEKIEYIHSTGFGMLIEIGNRLKMMGGKLCLFFLPDKFKTPFELMGMSKAMSLCKDEEEAIVCLQKPRKDTAKIETQLNITPINLSKHYQRTTGGGISTSFKMKGMSKTNQVYLIYDKADEEIAKNLEQSILSQGYSIIRDKNRSKEKVWDIENSQKMQESPNILLLWTFSASTSDIVNKEWIFAYGIGKKIIPCIKEESPVLPLPLQSLICIDLRYYDKALNAIKERILSTSEPYLYNILPPFSYIPFSASPYFVEREQELVQLYNLILNNKKAIISHDGAFIESEGIGKTRLAIEFAYRFAFSFPDGILWINASGNFHKELQMAAYDLGLVEVSPNFQLSVTCLRKLKSYIQTHPKMLLIFDNLEDTTLLEKEIAPEIVPRSLNCHILCTTNSKNNPSEIETLFLEPLSTESSIKLLLNIAKNRQGEEIEMLRSLVNLARGLPLALEMMAKYLLSNAQLSIMQYYRSFSEQRNSVEETGKLSLTILFNNILKKQADLIQDDYTQKLLEIAGWFPKSSILSKETLGLFVGVAPDTVRAQVYLKNPIERLQELSFVEAIGDHSIRLHPYVYHYFQSIRYTIDVEQQKNAKKKAVERMFSCYQDFSRLEKDYEKRGFIPVLEDIETALLWHENHAELKELQKYLHRESHAIQQQRFMPHYFIQQLYSRIYGESDNENLLLKSIQDSLPRVSWQKGSFWLKRCNKFSHPLSEHHEIFVSTMNRAAFSSNSQQMAFASFDNLSSWDTHTGKIVQTFLPSSSGSRAVVFNPQGSRLIAAHFNEVKSWNVNDSKDVYTLVKQTDCILSLALSSLDVLACAGKDRVISLWDIPTSKEKGILRGHTSNIHSLCFSKDASKLLSGSYDKSISLWEVGKSDALYTMRAHCDVVTALCFSPNGDTFVSGGKDGQIRLWESSTGIPIGSLAGHRGEITSIAFCPQGNYILSAGTDTCLKLWEASSGKLLQTFVAEYPVIQCQFSQDGNYIWACDALPSIYKFRLMKINVAL